MIKIKFISSLAIAASLIMVAFSVYRLDILHSTYVAFAPDYIPVSAAALEKHVDKKQLAENYIELMNENQTNSELWLSTIQVSRYLIHMLSGFLILLSTLLLWFVYSANTHHNSQTPPAGSRQGGSR